MSLFFPDKETDLIVLRYIKTRKHTDMNQKHFVFSMISLLFTMHVNASSIQNKKPIIDKFLLQLKNNIELNKKYQQSIAKQSHTITSIAETDIGIEDFLGICQSLYGKGKSDEMVSVVTVRYSNKGEKYNASDFLKEFMYAIQEHTETGRKIIYHDTLCITVDYIKQTDLGVFDMLNTTTKQIRKIRQKYNEIVIDHFYEIASACLKELMMSDLVHSICKCFDENLGRISFDKETLDQYAESAYEYMTEDFAGIDSTDVFYGDATWEINNPNSIYNTIRAKISEYEKSINFEYYTNNLGSLKEYFNFLINCRHREVLTKNIKDLALLCVPIIKSPDNKKKFKDIFTTTCIRVHRDLQSDISQTQHLPFRNILYTSEILEASKSKEAIKFFCNSIILTEIRNKLEKLVQKNIAPLYQELSTDKIVTVVCNKKINDQSIIHMCRVLNDSKIIEDLHDNQIIHIENGSLITKEQIDMNVTNLQLKNLAGKNCPITVRTLSTEAPANGELEVLSYQLLLHTFQISKDGTREWISQSDTRNLPDDKAISIDTVGEYDKYISNAITTCVENNNSKIAGHHTIAITKSTESVYLHILHHLSNDQKKPEILSLIYAIQPKRKSLVHLHPMILQRQIKCLDNVPTSLLQDLSRYLQSLLVKNQKFEIPNQVTLKNGQKMQIETTIFDIGSMHPKQFLSQSVKELYNCNIYWKMCRFIPLKELIEHEFNKPPANRWVFCITDIMNISKSKFNEIFYTIIMKKHAITSAEKIPYTIDKFCMVHEIYLYYTHHADGSIILNICETEENTYNAKISINPYTVYAEILENKEFARIIDAFDYTLRGLGFSGSFAALIINDIYKRKTHGIGGCLNYYVIKNQKRYTNMVKNLVDSAIKLDQDDVHNTSGNVQSPRSLYQHVLLDIMKEEKVKLLIEAMVIELCKITSKRLIKITTVKIIPTSDDNSMRNKLKRMKLSEDDNQYENLAHLTCLGCQEYNKSNDDE